TAEGDGSQAVSSGAGRSACWSYHAVSSCCGAGAAILFARVVPDCPAGRLVAAIAGFSSTVTSTGSPDCQRYIPAAPASNTPTASNTLLFIVQPLLVVTHIGTLPESIPFQRHQLLQTLTGDCPRCLIAHTLAVDRLVAHHFFIQENNFPDHIIAGTTGTAEGRRRLLQRLYERQAAQPVRVAIITADPAKVAGQRCRLVIRFGITLHRLGKIEAFL